jgi:hypothetical protein
MTVLKVERLDESTYNRITILRDCKGRVKKIINGYCQPKKNLKTMVVNKKEYALDWSNV